MGSGTDGPLRRRLILATIALPVACAGLLVADLSRLSPLAFVQAARSSVERAEELAVRAQDFDQARALEALGPSALNPGVIHLDTRLDTATVRRPGDTPQAGEGTVDPLRVEFEPDDAVPFQTTEGDFTVVDGVLRYTHQGERCLANGQRLDIDPRRVGALQVRLRQSKGGNVVVGWWDDAGPANNVTLSTVPPDGRFHTYHVDTDVLLHNSLNPHHDGGDGRVHLLFLQGSTTPGDEIEVDFIRLISKDARFAASPTGTAHHETGGELRSVLYTRSPLGVGFPLALPGGAVQLTTGLTVLHPEEPVQFRVVVRCESAEEEVLAVEVADPEAWHDVRVDLSRWAGREVEMQLLTDGEAPNVGLWSSPVVFGEPRERLNVVILLEDALREDHLTHHGYARDTSPFKSGFFGDGAVFLNAYSQATKTRPSCPSMMTSLYPTATGVWSFDHALLPGYVTLAEVLRDQGFATAAFVQNPNAGQGAGLHQGFDVHVGRGAVGTRSEELFGERLDRWVEDHADRNLFLYLHLMDPHAPYAPPAPFDAWHRELPSQGDGSPVDPFLDPDGVSAPSVEGRRARYDGEIAHNDALFEAFVQRLGARVDLDQTLILVVGDHGEHLGEHGLWEHNPPGYRQVLHVPLLMRYPSGFGGGQVVREPVQLLDVMPTVLDFAGIDSAPLMVSGDSLAPLLREQSWPAGVARVVMSDEVVHRAGRDDLRPWASVFHGRWHALSSGSLEGEVIASDEGDLRVFDVAADPREESPRQRYAANPLVADRVRTFVRRMQGANHRIYQAMESADLASGADRTIEIDPADLERLRALGYVE